MIFYELILLLLLGVFAIYDIRFKKVRNIALLLFSPFCLLSIPLHYCIEKNNTILLYSIIGFFTGSVILLLISILTNGGIGGGDIKLTALLGIIYGPYQIVGILFLASLTTMVFSLLKTYISKKRESRLPFVPFILLGCLVLFLFKS